MFPGLLIGLALFGVLLIICNGDRGPHDPVRTVRSYARMIGYACFLIGTCGVIGWLNEVH